MGLEKTSRTLLFLRHAKSDWGDLDLDDHGRPLAPRGAKAAPKMGAYIASKGFKPSLILCSDAVRTRATCALVVPELGQPVAQVEILDALYLAPPVTMLDLIRNIDDGHDTAMIIAHNPGMHALALTLTRHGDKAAIKDMSMKFPTAALAVLSFDCPSWSDIGPATGRLDDFQVPRGLK